MLHLITGIVTEIAYCEADLHVMLQTESEQKIVFIINEDQFLIDEHGNALTWACVAAGNRISAVLSDTTPMTMSIPPQISGAYGYVLTESEQIVCGSFDETMTDKDLLIALEPDDTTCVRNLQGETISIADCDFSEVIIVFGRSTRSIPAFVVPSCVICN